MIGRIKRTGQKRAKICVVSVMMRGTIVELLHERHTSADSVNMSLEALAQHYGPEILRMCDEAAEEVKSPEEPARKKRKIV